MNRLLRTLAVLLLLVGVTAVGVSYFFGSIRVQREASSFIAALQTCSPFEQQAWVPIVRGTMMRSVVGMEDGSCVVTMDALGAGQIRCALDANTTPLMVQFIQTGADTVGFLGGQTVSLRYSSEGPDPMTELLNGPNCAIEQ